MSNNKSRKYIRYKETKI